MKSEENDNLNQVDEVAKAGVKSPANTAAVVISPPAPAVVSALAEKDVEKFEALTGTVPSTAASLPTSSPLPNPVPIKEPAAVIAPPATAPTVVSALAEKAAEKFDALTGTVASMSLSTSSPIPAPVPIKESAAVIAPAPAAEKAAEKFDILTGAVSSTATSISTPSPLPNPVPIKETSVAIVPAIAEKAIEKVDALTGTVASTPTTTSLSKSIPISSPVSVPIKEPSVVITAPAVTVTLAEKAADKSDNLTGTVASTTSSKTAPLSTPTVVPIKEPAAVIAPPATAPAVVSALAEKAAEKFDFLTGTVASTPTTPSLTASLPSPIPVKEPAVTILPQAPAAVVAEKAIEKVDALTGTVASVTTSSPLPTPVPIKELSNVEDQHSKEQVALEVKDLTEQNNLSESASASVDAVNAVDVKEKEKDAPAGTWNAWLGNTGMKAAGLGMGIATAGWDATRTSIAKVQNFGSGNPKYAKAYKSFSVESLSIEIMVNAGTATSIPFFVPKGSAMIWKVMVKSLDISFSLKQRVQEDGGAVEVDLEVPRKITSGEMAVGVRDAVDGEDRRILICVSNAHNKLQSKMLTYQVLIALPEKVAEMKAHYATQEQEYAQAVDEVAGDSTATTANTGDDKAEAEVPITSKDKGQDEGDRDVLVDVDTKSDEAPSGNSYMNNFYAISSSVMKRAQTASAVQYIQTTGGGMMSKLWGKKTDDAATAEAELDTKEGRIGVSYDIDSERDEGGDGSYDEEERRASISSSTLATPERNIYGNLMSADSGDGTEGVVIAPKVQY